MADITIKDMQQLAAKREGKCMSKKYIDSQTKLIWKCKNGHQWKAIPNAIKRGSWCRECFVERMCFSIKDIQAIAIEQGGRCLSKKYKNAHSKLEFECEHKHRWITTARNVMDGRWCHECGKQKQGDTQRIYGFDEVVSIVKARGGRCLSAEDEYSNLHSRLRLECDQKHQWSATANSIVMSQCWCADCAGVKKKTMDDMHGIAKANFGQCLSTHYETAPVKLTWQCHSGHIWDATYRTAKNTWCAECKGSRQRKLPTPWNAYTIETMRIVAHKRGWKVLSKTYKNVQTDMDWQCDKGHKIKLKAGSVMKNVKCPTCTPRKHTLKRMQELAKNKGGACLSKTYVNANAKLKWRCKEGHEWQATASKIIRGSWCRQCAWDSYKVKNKK